MMGCSKSICNRIVVTVCALSATAVYGQEEMVIVAEAAPPSPNANDFKELGIEFDCFDELGARIQRAREVRDLVGLAFAARDLSVAEQLSGKKLKRPKALQLEKDVLRMAAGRRNDKELDALALIMPQHKAEIDKIRQQTTSGKEIKAEGIQRSLIVANRTDQWIDVIVGDDFELSIAPGETERSLVKHGEHQKTVLRASSRDGALRWRQVVKGRVADHKFVLKDE